MRSQSEQYEVYMSLSDDESEKYEDPDIPKSLCELLELVQKSRIFCIRESLDDTAEDCVTQLWSQRRWRQSCIEEFFSGIKIITCINTVLCPVFFFV